MKKLILLMCIPLNTIAMEIKKDVRQLIEYVEQEKIFDECPENLSFLYEIMNKKPELFGEELTKKMFELPQSKASDLDILTLKSHLTLVINKFTLIEGTEMLEVLNETIDSLSRISERADSITARVTHVSEVMGSMSKENQRLKNENQRLKQKKKSKKSCTVI